MRFLFCLIIMLVAASTSLYSQEDNATEESVGKVSFGVKSMNFFRNNEYFNPIGSSGFHMAGQLPLYLDKSQWLEGYSLPGFFLRPEIVYEPTEQITLRGGGHLTKYWGTENFTEIRPVFSASLRLAESTILTLGSLLGSESHRMFDPNFNSERLYTAYAEDGLQVTTSTTRIFNDAWISWENFVFAGDTERESFTFGDSYRYTSPEFLNLISFQVPVQIQLRHFGGQISNYPEPVLTFFNMAAGLRTEINTGEGTGSIGLEYIAFSNSVFPERKAKSITKGGASWVRLHYNLKGFSFMTSYWHANDFYSPNGNPIFASIFVFDSDYVVHKRELVTGSASLRLLPEKHFELFFGAEAYYDTRQDRLDHALTLHLNFDRLFRL